MYDVGPNFIDFLQNGIKTDVNFNSITIRIELAFKVNSSSKTNFFLEEIELATKSLIFVDKINMCQNDKDKNVIIYMLYEKETGLNKKKILKNCDDLLFLLKETSELYYMHLYKIISCGMGYDDH